DYYCMIWHNHGWVF
nr:immunoglobulin light chain junction region [Macaca mulatta]